MIQINWRPSSNELRIFAIGQILFFAIVATSLFRRGYSLNLVLGIVAFSATIGLMGLIQPSFMRGIYLGWMIAVFPIGWCVSQLLLAAVFVLVIIPLGLILKCLQIDPLSRPFEPKRVSYWTRRRPMPPTSRYFRQF